MTLTCTSLTLVFHESYYNLKFGVWYSAGFWEPIVVDPCMNEHEAKNGSTITRYEVENWSMIGPYQAEMETSELPDVKMHVIEFTINSQTGSWKLSTVIRYGTENRSTVSRYEAKMEVQ